MNIFNIHDTVEEHLLGQRIAECRYTATHTGSTQQSHDFLCELQHPSSNASVKIEWRQPATSDRPPTVGAVLINLLQEMAMIDARPSYAHWAATTTEQDTSETIFAAKKLRHGEMAIILGRSMPTYVSFVAEGWPIIEWDYVIAAHPNNQWFLDPTIELMPDQPASPIGYYAELKNLPDRARFNSRLHAQTVIGNQWLVNCYVKRIYPKE